MTFFFPFFCWVFTAGGVFLGGGEREKGNKETDRERERGRERGRVIDPDSYR